jgi:hypothetical protein
MRRRDMRAGPTRDKNGVGESLAAGYGFLIFNELKGGDPVSHCLMLRTLTWMGAFEVLAS